MVKYSRAVFSAHCFTKVVCAIKAIRACLIKERRLAKGLTQQQLADRALLTKSRVWDYENLRNVPSVIIAKRIADVLGCTIDDLYEWHSADTD